MTAASDAPLVCVVVVRWNAAEETARCLRSLLQGTYPNAAIVVVDYASTDGAGPALAREFPSVTFLTMRENLGYAGGCNAGVAWARRAGARYVFLLNNDTVVEANALDLLVRRAQSLDRPAILAPKILRADHPDRVWSAGARLDRRRPPGLHIGMDEDERLHNQPAEVDWATGCALFFPMSVVDRVGLMDARYFLYLEDTDWCLRARRAGVPVWFVPEARLWHEVSVSVSSLRRGSLRYYVYRNTYRFVFRNLGPRERILFGVDLLWTLAKIGVRVALFPSYRADREYHARTVALLDVVRGRTGRATWAPRGAVQEGGAV
jgi:GT2 family glycosyltransferase